MLFIIVGSFILHYFLLDHWDQFFLVGDTCVLACFVVNGPDRADVAGSVFVGQDEIDLEGGAEFKQCLIQKDFSGLVAVVDFLAALVE